jgi:cell division protein FtsI/penicillin-binding protein 2
LSIGVLAISIFLIYSLYRIQVLNGSIYLAKAEKQHNRPVSSIFDRGSIYFTTKENTRNIGATVEQGYTIYMNPSVIQDPIFTYDLLSKYLKLDKENFISRANNKDEKYRELAKRVSPDIASNISSLGLLGIGTVKENWRAYPADSLFAQTIGIIGESVDEETDETIVSGRYGIERYYENILAREKKSNASILSELFGADEASTSDIIDEESEVSPSKPGDIVTTLEPTVGVFVENILEETKDKWKSDEIGAIIMDPKTGNIISMVLLPSFDPNNTKSVSNVKLFSNPLVENVYEMGSIMKPITMAMGLDSGAITTASTYDDTGTMTLDDRKISNYDGRARGKTDMQQILSQSLNIGATFIALRSGAENMYRYFSKIGFGSITGIDLPVESRGLVKDFRNAKQIDIATASYGQGVAISPMVMTRALSVLANGGDLVTPRLVSRIEYKDGTRENVEQKDEIKVFRKETTEDVTSMLVNVFDNALLGGTKKHEHYSIAAKTGTAQIPDPVNGGYYKDRYLHSFFGYFPAYDAKFIVFIYQIYPKDAQYASETLTDPFDQIATFLLDYYSVPPDR